MSKTLHNILIALGKTETLTAKSAAPGNALPFLLENSDNFDEAHEKYFKDTQSRQIFDWILQSRIVTDLFGKPAPEVLDNIPYPRHQWNHLLRQAKAMKPVVIGDYTLDRIDTWLLEAYSLKGLCEVEPGDTVLDCGAYTGNTSVYFAQKTGPSGHVYGFEPAPMLFALYNSNIQPYGNVTAINAALTDSAKLIGPNTTMGFSGNFCGARFAESGQLRVPVTAIDAFVHDNSLPCVDFIKMDIEGAEADALQGAAKTICEFRPKMAISAYHKPDDLFALPRLIATICPGYQFALRHFSDNLWETVMYCLHSESPDYFGKDTTKDRYPLSRQRLCEKLEATLERRFKCEITLTY
ncbi:MAG: FkbM family methyltransferase [Deltaproteobacteria bacterium]|nr:FkbM family methyltransferase [Deltaproteobacteria bacterium]